jgi:hypothetical protein
LSFSVWAVCFPLRANLWGYSAVKWTDVKGFWYPSSPSAVWRVYLLCSPLARVFLWLLNLPICSHLFNAKIRVYTQSYLSASWVKSCVRVWAFYLPWLGLWFYPCGPCAWWQESSFSLWHRDPLLIHELNLCLSILNRIYTYCGYCATFRGKVAVSGMSLTHLDLILLQNCLN